MPVTSDYNAPAPAPKPKPKPKARPPLQSSAPATTGSSSALASELGSGGSLYSTTAKKSSGQAAASLITDLVSRLSQPTVSAQQSVADAINAPGTASGANPNPSASDLQAKALADTYLNQRENAATQTRNDYYGGEEGAKAVHGYLHPDAAKAEKQKDARDQRKKALNLGKDKADVARMTPEEYLALSDRERAAVDFNGMLVRAVRRDRNLQDEYSPRDEADPEYEKTVKKMFGSDGGSETYAPETAAVLAQIGFKDQAADMDDFLSLKAAITSKDIKRLGPEIGPSLAEGRMASNGNEAGLDRLGLVKDLTAATDQMQESLVRGNQMLASLNQTATAVRNETVELFGGEAKDVKLSLGYGAGEPGSVTSEHDAYFKDAFERLAARDPGKSPQEVLGDINADFGMVAQKLGKPELQAELYRQFVEYSNTRSYNADQYDYKLSDVKGVKHRTPEQYRRLLGMDPVAEAQSVATGKPANPGPAPETILEGMSAY